MTSSGRGMRIRLPMLPLLTGILAGAILVQPALAHVTRKVSHTWKHLQPLADARYVLHGTPVAWSSIQGIPGGFADGTDNEGGGGPATDLSCAGCVGTADLADGAVTSAKIPINAVGASQIADAAVGTSEIATDGVGSSEIATNAVGLDEIASSSVGSEEVGDNSLGAIDLGSASVGASELNLVLGPEVTVAIPGGAGENGAYNVDQVIASCAAGQIVIGASIGFASNAGANQELFIRDSLRLTSTTWLVQGGNDSGNDATLVARALCLG